MIRAMWTAATGMNAQQLNINTIAHNLANVNTVAFKRSRAEFADLIYQAQRLPGTSASNVGVFPAGIQVGTGVRPVTVTKEFQQGNMRQTNNQLDLSIIEYREFKLADGSSEKLPVVGPVSVEFANRRTICYVVSTRDEVLLGSIPMEDLDVILNPRRQTIEINSESPYLPTMKLK